MKIDFYWFGVGFVLGDKLRELEATDPIKAYCYKSVLKKHFNIEVI